MAQDILIIGGGVIGLSIARELSKKGVSRITVLEKGQVGREASWAAAGILAPQAETDRIDDFFRICAASRDLYPEFAAQLKLETEIDIELDRAGTLYPAFTDHDLSDIGKRFEWQSAAGLPVEYLSARECRKLEPAISQTVKAGLFFPSDWQVENRKLLTALQEFARRTNIGIVENKKVETLLTKGSAVIGARSLDGEVFLAEQVILATGAWTSFIKIGEKQGGVSVRPIRGQMICFRLDARCFRHVIYAHNGYLVPRADGRVLVGATVEDAGFDANTTSSGIDHLQRVAASLSSELSGLSPVDQWAGLRPSAADGLPIVGPLPFVKNVHIATAHFRNGILLAPMTARIIAEAVAEDKSSEFFECFGPQRFRLADAKSS